MYLFVHIFILCPSDLSVSPSIAAAFAYLILSLHVNLVGLEELSSRRVAILHGSAAVPCGRCDG